VAAGAPNGAVCCWGWPKVEAPPNIEVCGAAPKAACCGATPKVEVWGAAPKVDVWGAAPKEVLTAGRKEFCVAVAPNAIHVRYCLREGSG
jgi:hypothetical protein